MSGPGCSSPATSSLTAFRSTRSPRGITSCRTSLTAASNRSSTRPARTSEEATVAYTREKPRLTRPVEELRRDIPGWGVDLDPKDRPSVPKEKFEETGARWDFPERQPEHWPREKSTEHRFVTPVFGTAQPLRGVSGAVRRYAYTFSEGRTAHWLLLIIGDRVDILESRVEALLKGQPDNPISETGVLAEFKRSAFRTRFGQHRADLKHQPLDLLLWAAPYLALAAGVYMLAQQGQSRRRLR